VGDKKSVEDASLVGENVDRTISPRADHATLLSPST